MKWIKNHKVVSSLLLVIIITVGILVGSVVSGGGNNPLTGVVGSIVGTVEKPIASIGDSIANNLSGVFDYKDLQKENDRLKEENEALKKQMAGLTLSANQLQELQDLKGALKYKSKANATDMVSGDVISMDGMNWLNLFTINIGSASGVKKGNIVVCGDGLVGKISSVGKNWSKVTSIIDESTKVSFKVAGNMKLIGVIEGSSDGSLTGFMIDSNSKVSEGDKLITSGMGVYPSGIEIGKVTKVQYDSDAQLQRVTVKPFADFKSLQKVSVII